MKNYQEWINDNRSSILRGNDSSLVDTWRISQCDFEAKLSKNTRHIMLLTMDEANAVLSDLYNKGTTFAGNIKDTYSAAKNTLKLVSYIDAGKLVFNLKGFGIKAVSYLHKGVTYIKITGYPSLRRILNGTRYSAMNPKILELGIGTAGIDAGIMSGARFCIYFAFAQRVVKFIFSSEHDLTTFIGNITMDVSKAIVAIFLTKLVVAASGWCMTAIAASVTLPISVGIVLIVVLGFAITGLLMYLDEHYRLSERLINTINEGLKAHQEIMTWNIQHSDPYLFPITSWNY